MNETALITGASGGIGRALCEVYAERGFDLVLTARREEKLRLLAEELSSRFGVRCHVFACDLALPDAADRIFDFTRENGINIARLVNNAGFGDYGRFICRDIEKQSSMIAVNINSLVRLCRLYLPELESRRGKVLNIASIGSFVPGPLMSVYYASKAFVLSFSEALAVECRKTGVTVTAVCPGPTDSGFWDAADLKRQGALKNFRAADCRAVARFAYKACERGRVTAICGTACKAGAFAVRFAPRALVRRAVGLIQK